MRAGVLLAVALAGCSAPSRQTAHASPDATLQGVRRFIAARDTVDERTIGELISPSVASFSGDLVTGPADYGIAALLKTWKARSATVHDRCVLQLALVGVRTATALVHCTSQVTAKQNPLQRTRQLFRIYELAFGPDGKITRITTWWDGLRALRQVGVMEEADDRPDVATGREVVAFAQQTPAEITNQLRARALVNAIDQEDTTAVARTFSPGYVHHQLSSATPRTFAVPTDVAPYFRTRLATCAAWEHPVLETAAVDDWVVLRFGEGCTNGDVHSFAPHLWLLHFSGERATEGWEVWGRQEELRQLGKLFLPDQRARMAKAGF